MPADLSAGETIILDTVPPCRVIVLSVDRRTQKVRVREPALLERVRARGLALGKALDQLVKRHASLATARGLGLLRAIELAATAAYDPPALVRAAREHGLLLVRGGERAVRLLPPLTVTTGEIKQAIARLDRALDGLESGAAETA